MRLRNKLASQHEGVTFLLINLKGLADGASYKSMHSLDSEKLLHGAGRPPSEYGLRYIPHKVIIGKDGQILKNFDHVNLTKDVEDLK